MNTEPNYIFQQCPTRCAGGFMILLSKDHNIKVSMSFGTSTNTRAKLMATWAAMLIAKSLSISHFMVGRGFQDHHRLTDRKVRPPGSGTLTLEI